MECFIVAPSQSSPDFGRTLPAAILARGPALRLKCSTIGGGALGARSYVAGKSARRESPPMTVQAQAPARSLESELQALRAEPQRLQGEARARDEFLAVVAHELRAPVGAILGWVHLLARRGGEEEFRKGLEVIEQSAEVQGKLIQDLLVMSRMASNRMSFELAQVDLRGVIDAAVDAVRPAAEA